MKYIYILRYMATLENIILIGVKCEKKNGIDYFNAPTKVFIQVNEDRYC